MRFRNVFLAVAMIILVSAGGLPGRTARAENPEWCPKAVTVTKMKNGAGEFFRKYLSPALDNPTVCLNTWKNGPAERALYSFPPGVEAQDGSALTFTSDSLDRRRAGFRAVLAGHTDKAGYVINGGFPGQACCWAGTETLARKSQEDLLIGGQVVSTIRLEYTYNSITGITRYAWSLWYDPERHLFVKGVRPDGGYHLPGGAIPPAHLGHQTDCSESYSKPINECNQRVVKLIVGTQSSKTWGISRSKSLLGLMSEEPDGIPTCWRTTLNRSSGDPKFLLAV